MVPRGSAVSTGVNESEALVRTSETRCVSEDVDELRSDSFANQKSTIPGDVDSEHPAPISVFFNPWTRMLYAAFQSRSAVIGQMIQATTIGFMATFEAMADGSIADVDAEKYWDIPLVALSTIHTASTFLLANHVISHRAHSRSRRGRAKSAAQDIESP